MSRKAKGIVRESISPYLTRLSVIKKADQENLCNVAITDPREKNMAASASRPSVASNEVSNAELRTLLLEMRAELNEKMDKQMDKLEETVQKVTDRVESLEMDVGNVRDQQTSDRKKISSLQEDLYDLRRSLLQSELYGRKYNLLIHGLKGYETSAPETISAVRTFFKGPLGLSAETVDKMAIRNAHRLQRKLTGETPIIVVFLIMYERETVLRSGKNLKDTGIRVTPDLPPVLKKVRGALSHEAYSIRQSENLQTRIRNKGVDFWLEVRCDSNDPWKKRKVELMLPENKE